MTVGEPPVSKATGAWFARLVAKPRFQELASRLPFARGMARRDGAEIFDLVQGFVRSQALFALVELNILQRLLDGPRRSEDLAFAASMQAERMQVLLNAGAAMGLLKRRRDGTYALARKGAAILGVPGLQDMIRHHDVFYRDLSDPVALLRNEKETELSRFWPYVFGGENVPAGVATRYSDLMAHSQGLVAQDTLRQVSLKGVRKLVDVGGGSGAFLMAVARKYRQPELVLFDLPEVMPSAAERLSRAGLQDRIVQVPGSFRRDDLPAGADAISLVRVLYDHADETVTDLLARAFAALPSGGRLIISEPMAGSAGPDPAGDVYFAFYTMAMGTGKARSAERIAQLCKTAGFEGISTPKPARAYVTSVVTALKP